MVAHRRRLARLVERRRELGLKIAGNGGGLSRSDVDALDASLNEEAGHVVSAVNEIQARGVLVKDLDTGLVDFPAVREGEEVLLCWQLGEDEVAWWHRPEDGFAGRRPL